ncbi:hypothetical protein D3C79_954810 [compost metagenome]
MSWRANTWPSARYFSALTPVMQRRIITSRAAISGITLRANNSAVGTRLMATRMNRGVPTRRCRKRQKVWRSVSVRSKSKMATTGFSGVCACTKGPPWNGVKG